MELISIAGYSTKAQQSLFEFVIARPETWTVPIATISRYKTLPEQLAHCLGAEQRWMARVQGRPQPERYESTAPDDVERIQDDWRRRRAITTAAIESTTTADRERLIECTLPGWEFVEVLSVEEIFFHIFNHESYHRAQCSMMLQAQSVDPPNFDYVFYKR